MKNIKRRFFIKSSSLVAGGLVLPSFNINRMANNSNNKKLKVSVVGCGGRGTGAAVQALRADDNVELVAMADAFKDRLENSLTAIKQEMDGEKTIDVKEKNQFTGFNGYKKAIDLADVVILATPPGFRPIHFKYAIDNDKHVFMEKPVATDAHGVRQVLETAKVANQKKLNVVVGLQRRYQYSYLNILKQVRRGVIGKITSGQVRWNGAGVWVRGRKPNQTEMEYQMRNWYYFNWLCGDHIVEQHIHNIDVANWFLNEYPISAQGMGGREVRKGIDHGEIFDHHFVEFKYASGATISSQCRHQPGTHRQVNELIVGTKGKVNITNKGVIGKITSGQVRWNGAGVWVRGRKPNQTEMEYQMRNWYYFNWLCGDHIVEQHIHNIDVANWFLNEYPISAQGMGGREVRKGIDHGEIFDHHFVEFKYASGATISSQCRHQPGRTDK